MTKFSTAEEFTQKTLPAETGALEIKGKDTGEKGERH